MDKVPTGGKSINFGKGDLEQQDEMMSTFVLNPT
jgi:hypothetical protein